MIYQFSSSPSGPLFKMAKRSLGSDFKQDSSTVSGYIKDINSLPHMKDRFFTISLQTSPEKETSAICFDITKKKKMVSFKESGSLVKLVNVRFNNDPKKTHLSQVILNSRTVITTPEKSEVDFDMATATQFTAIESIHDVTEGTIINVKGYLVADLSSTTMRQTRDNRSIRMLEGCTLKDLNNPDTMIDLMLWEDSIDAVSKAFAEDNHVLIFQNVRVRNFFQRQFLTTISNTTTTVADVDIKPTLAMQSALPARQHNERYQKISVKKVAFISHYSFYYNCQNCKKKVTDSTFLKNVKCDTCFAVQRLSDCNTTVTVKVTPEVEGPSYTVFEEVLCNFFTTLKPTLSADDVTDALLSASNITFTVDTMTKIVTKIAWNTTELQEDPPCNSAAVSSITPPDTFNSTAPKETVGLCNPAPESAGSSEGFVPLLHLEAVPSKNTTNAEEKKSKKGKVKKNN